MQKGEIIHFQLINHCIYICVQNLHLKKGKIIHLQYSDNDRHKLRCSLWRQYPIMFWRHMEIKPRTNPSSIFRFRLRFVLETQQSHI